MTRWNKFDHDDHETWPDEANLYAVRISGDSERDGPHVFYEFEDYTTFAIIDKLRMSFKGEHDEEKETCLGWYGPIVIPEYDL